MSGKHSRQEAPRAPRQRRDHPPRMPRPKQHDTYVERSKAAGATVCDGCGLVFHAGRWSPGPPPVADLGSGLCPACERVRDRYPAGTLRLPAAFLENREEVLNLIRNAEEAERPEHPLERLMDVEDLPEGGLVVTTTGIHLARAIAHKLERRFHRPARIRYPAEQNLVHVDWET